MQHRPRLTHDETLAVAQRLEKLFKESEWTPEQFDLFRSRIAGFSRQHIIDGMDDYRTACRFRTPVLADIIEAVKRRQSPLEQSRQATEIERMRESEAKYHRVKAREMEVSRELHIPELLDRGEEHALRGRDRLIAGMGHAENFSQRNVAGRPTWAELTDPAERRARVLCWRYWIIMDSCEAFAPELANV